LGGGCCGDVVGGAHPTGGDRFSGCDGGGGVEEVCRWGAASWAGLGGCGWGWAGGFVSGELFGSGGECEVWVGGGDTEWVVSAGGWEVRVDGSAGDSAAGADERGGVGGSGS
jgi:hypothetical protein